MEVGRGGWLKRVQTRLEAERLDVARPAERTLIFGQDLRMHDLIL